MLFELVAEFLGTFIYILVILTTLNPIYIGVTIAILVAIFSNMSGVNFNPAVTIASLYNGTIHIKSIIPYITVQICGGLLAVYVGKHFKLF